MTTLRYRSLCRYMMQSHTLNSEVWPRGLDVHVGERVRQCGNSWTWGYQKYQKLWTSFYRWPVLNQFAVILGLQSTGSLRAVTEQSNSLWLALVCRLFTVSTSLDVYMVVNSSCKHNTATVVVYTVNKLECVCICLNSLLQIQFDALIVSCRYYHGISLTHVTPAKVVMFISS